MTSFYQFNSMVSDIKNFSQIMRSRNILNCIHRACPKYCPTRWTILYDISLWIVKNFLRIKKMLYQYKKHEKTLHMII